MKMDNDRHIRNAQRGLNASKMTRPQQINWSGRSRVFLHSTAV